MNVHEFKRLPIMGILRGVKAGIIEPLVETAITSGLKTIEITMNTPDASNLIARMVKAAGGRLTVGAGTVLTMDELDLALDSGASFIVTPTLIRDVVQRCKNNKIPVFPGALTPKEIYEAWQAGATMVKVFPAKFFGPGYFREITGPFDDIELLACGGITPENIKEFFMNGASGVAFGGSVFNKVWLESGDFSKIENSIRRLVLAFQQ